MEVYLNLEPANILVCSGRSLGRTVQVKLANFETTQTVATNGTQIKGTYNFDYAAPEILEEAQAFPQSDVWSLGVLLYVLMSGHLPFKGETPEESKDNILRVQFKFEWLYKECTMEGTRLLMWIFKRKPHARPSLEEVGAQVDQPRRLHAEEEGARKVPHQQDPEVLQGLPQEQALHGHGQSVLHGQTAPVNQQRTFYADG